MHNVFAAAIAAVTLFLCSADATLAQKKKQPQAGRSSFQECCEKAYGVFSLNPNAAGHCWVRAEQQHDAFIQCVNQQGIRVKGTGQRTG